MVDGKGNIVHGVVVVSGINFTGLVHHSLQNNQIYQKHVLPMYLLSRGSNNNLGVLQVRNAGNAVNQGISQQFLRNNLANLCTALSTQLILSGQKQLTRQDLLKLTGRTGQKVVLSNLKLFLVSSLITGISIR